ncbi:MAG TPA: polysaccharide biosynthesis/export family protein [Bryobacteraceae bacterium]|nr:polysaccharide biosynthesis/export family protein [Bryobacteraceae bacterium]
MLRFRNWLSVLLFTAAGCFTSAVAQQQQGGAQNPQAGQTPAQATQLPPETIRPNYVLGPNDQIMIREPDAEEINEKPFRLDADGNITLPLLGKVHAAGMTQQELEADLNRRLREYIRQPQAIVVVTQFRSEPVFFVGAFRSPGIYPLQGRRTLVEMLTAVGGLQPNASRHITVTRREEYGAIPLPNAVVDPARKVSTVEISMGSLRENVNPAEDIVLQPYDVISVGRAELVYISGEVGKTGGIELGERDSITILQALIQAGGVSRDAKKDKVRILRPVLGTNRRYEIDVDVARVFEGKDLDVPLLPNDVVYVPHSYSRQILQTTGQIIFPIIPYVIFIAAQ